MTAPEQGAEIIPEEVIAALVAVGEAHGVVTSDDMVSAMLHVELSSSVIDSLVERLRSQGAKVEFDPPTEDGDEHVLQSSVAAPTSLAGSLTDPLRAYLGAIGTVPLLNAPEERRLATMVVEGQSAAATLLESSRNMPTLHSEPELQRLRARVASGRKARDRLVESNLRLVVSIAKRYRHRGVGFLDLIQEGNAGLVRAVEKFDPERGFRVSTYATWWIRQAMGRAIADQARTIRIPAHVYDALGRMLRIQRVMLQELGREPSAGELASRMRLPVERVQDILAIDRSTVPFDHSGDEAGIGDVIADTHAEMPADAADRNALAEVLRDAVSGLDERERRLMTLRFGLEDGKLRSLEEVGKVFGVTRERVRQIESRTLAKLRTPLARQQIEDFLGD